MLSSFVWEKEEQSISHPLVYILSISFYKQYTAL